MTGYSWTTNVNGDWNTAANWTPSTVPNALTADVTIDATTTLGAYTVTLAAGESQTVNSLAINSVNNLTGANSHPYTAANFEMDGTLTFAPGSPGALSGALQTFMTTVGGTFVNLGTVDAFIQAQGNVLFTGTNGFYVTNWLQSLAGTVTVDTSSIAEIAGTTLFDGIYEAQGPGATIHLGGALQNLIVNIATITGPPAIPDGWTELLLNDPTAVIDEWNGTSYVSLESTLLDIGNRGTLDVLAGRNYATTHALAIDGGMLNLQAGTFSATALNINTGVVQGFATIAADVVNNGIMVAAGGTLAITGNLTGTGSVDFDIDLKVGTVATTGATLQLGTVSAGQTIVMNGDDTLILMTPSAFAGTIQAVAGDTIKLQGLTIDSAVVNAGTLVLSNGGVQVGALALGGSYASESFIGSGSIVSVSSLFVPSTTIEASGATRLVQIGTQFSMAPVAGGAGVTLQYQGAAITEGEFAAWKPIAAEQTSTGYEVAWQYGTSDQYTVWNTDGAGNYTGFATDVVAGSDPSLSALEPSFQQDLNGDGLVGLPVIEALGATSFLQYGTQFEMAPVAGGAGQMLQYTGSAVTVGEFGAWTPIAAEQTSTGYEVAWKYGAADLYTVWNTDSTGNFITFAIGTVSGGDPAFQSLETSFLQDLNGDGHIGLVPVPVEILGATNLLQMGNQFALNPAAGGSGVTLSYQSSPVTTNEFAAWAPIGAEVTSTGFEVAWKYGAEDMYTVWNTDSSGIYTGFATGVVAGSDPSLEALEPSFQQDLNGDGRIGLPVIEAAGATSLLQFGNQFEMMPVAGGVGTVLQYQDAAVTSGEFAAWTPIGAEQTSTGFDIAWKYGETDNYTVWTANSAGNYSGFLTPVVSGHDFTLESLEPTFHQDLNGDGRLSVSLSIGSADGDTLDLTGGSDAVTVNLGDDTASASPGLDAPSLTFIGSVDALTIGTGAATVEYALAPASGIETITNFTYGRDQLNIDLGGAANSVLQAYDTTVGGLHGIAIASTADLMHGVVLMNMTVGQTALDLMANHLTFSGGHALLG